MERCCRWCHYFDAETGYCQHTDMFEVEDIDSYGTNIKLLDIYNGSDEFGADTRELENIGFKVKNPREYSCCYWE